MKKQRIILQNFEPIQKKNMSASQTTVHTQINGEIFKNKINITICNNEYGSCLTNNHSTKYNRSTKYSRSKTIKIK